MASGFHVHFGCDAVAAPTTTTVTTIRCGVCGYSGPYNATEWFHHMWRRCRDEIGRMY